MERSLLCKTPANKLSPYLQSTRHTHFRGNNLVIQPRNGMLVFDFSQTTADEAAITFKRDSGNGLLVSYIGGKGKEHVVTSKTGQKITLPLGVIRKVHLYRTTRSRGDVSLIDLELYEKKAKIDWDIILSQLDEYTCLRIDSNNNLFASEGGVIKGTGVTVKTNPADATVTNNSGLKFISSCQILDLKVTEPKKTPKPNDIYIFDSSISGFDQASCVKANVENKNLNITHRGSYEVSLPNLKQGVSYTITVTAQLLSGNGKIMFGLLPDNNTSRYNVVRSKTPVNFSVQVTAMTETDYSLGIWRHPSSKGNILITRVCVKEDKSNQAVLSRLPRHIDIQGVVPVAPPPTAAVQGSLEHPINRGLTGAGLNVEGMSKHFAVFQKPVSVLSNDMVGDAQVHGHSARKWLSWLQVFYPKITESGNSKIAICDVNTLVSAERVWIGPFVGDHKSKIGVLKGTKVIFTPSLPNKIKLQEWLGDKANVQVLDLPLPKIENGYKPGGYFIYFDDFRLYTQQIFRIWNPEYSLNVVGTKEPIPVFAKYISEYEQFSVLSKKIAQAQGLISLTQNNHHRSGLIELALSMGIPVLTNNHRYFNKANVCRHTTDSPVSKIVLDEALKAMKRLPVDDGHNKTIMATLKRLGVV